MRLDSPRLACVFVSSTHAETTVRVGWCASTISAAAQPAARSSMDQMPSYGQPDHPDEPSGHDIARK